MRLDNAMQIDCGEADADALASALLPGLPIDLIRACYAAAPGNEIASGKFASPDRPPRWSRHHLAIHHAAGQPGTAAELRALGLAGVVGATRGGRAVPPGARHPVPRRADRDENRAIRDTSRFGRGGGLFVGCLLAAGLGLRK